MLRLRSGLEWSQVLAYLLRVVAHCGENVAVAIVESCCPSGHRRVLILEESSQHSVSVVLVGFGAVVIAHMAT